MKNLTKTIIEPFKTLRNKTFAKLYLAQTISLLGDAFTWVGIALLAFQMGGEHSATILAIALTMRVSAFIIFSPFAGVLADKIQRKKILYVTHFFRMGIVFCFVFVQEEWQLYGLVFLLNVFNAFFTPTYRAVIPQVVEKKRYREAIGLSLATYQVLGVLGPAFAGILALWFGAREIFIIDSISFVVAAIFILSVPSSVLQKGVNANEQSQHNTWKNVGKGIRLLFQNKIIRFALSIEFVSAIAGAMILVNTIGHVKGTLQLADNFYGYVMGAFGIGAAVAAFLAGSLDKSKTRALSLISGVFILGAALLFANYVPFSALLILWIIAGLGQSLAEMPSETLIGENIEPQDQGKVYGAHFAFSHLWWAIAYPIAGFLGTKFPEREFFYGGLLALALGVSITLIFKSAKRTKTFK